MGWHWLFSLLLAGVAVFACNAIGVPAGLTFFIAMAVFVVYWLGVVVIFGPGDGFDFDL